LKRNIIRWRRPWPLLSLCEKGRHSRVSRHRKTNSCFMRKGLGSG